MEEIKFIPISSRNKCRCHFCGSTVSVKYMFVKFESYVSTMPKYTVFACNKCALKRIELLKKEEAIT